jgi:hypothetical protein
MIPMRGQLEVGGHILARPGFLSPNLGPQGLEVGPSQPLFVGRGNFSPETSAAIERLQGIERADITGDLGSLLSQLGMGMKELERAITSSTSSFPVRENLEAEAKLLIPLDTPVRNMLPRSVGSGAASLWRQITSLGGGWGGDSLDQPGGNGSTNIRTFFSESGAPADHGTTYASKTASYKLMGTFGSITGFAGAVGNNFTNQYVAERTNALRNLMLNEEYALLSGSSTSTAAPWGDGSTALGFDGFTNLITTGNGTPSAQVQTSVGGLTLSHIDNQLARLWKQGGQQPYLICNAQEILSLVHLAEASGSIIRVQASAQADSILGVSVTGYKHPITGEIVPIYASRFLAAGTMLFGSKFLADGTPAADVQVLPQVQLPQLSPNEQFQGYTIQELAPTAAAPQVFAFCVSCYEVLRMKGSVVFGKSSGLTAV